MAMATPAPSLPNPYTPLAFLPPDLANQFEVSRYLFAITLGGYLWDIAVNLPSDYKLLFKHKIRYPTCIYYASRMTTLCYIITSFILNAGHVKDCNALLLSLGILYIFAQCLTSSLFLLRVAAVWRGNRPVIAFYVILWFGVLGGAMTVPFGLSSIHIGTTQACLMNKDAEWTQATAITLLINDSAVFIGITYKILTNPLVGNSVPARMKTFFGYGSIPMFSRMLLQGGQHYYLIAVAGNILVLVMIVVPGVPAIYRGMCTILITAVVNAMACIVFRKIKFGLVSPDGTTTIRGGSGSLQGLSSPVAHVLPTHYRRAQDPSYTVQGIEVSKTTITDAEMPLEVRIMRKGADGNISAQSHEG